MLYLIFTVDGDWKEYFNVQLPPEKRRPDPAVMRRLFAREIETATRCLEGRFLHFIHTSPCARGVFLKEPFTGLWRSIASGGGDVGVHCHEDLPYLEYHFEDIPRMEEVISGQVAALRESALETCSYRGGFLAFTHTLIPVLEKNGIRFDFSCEPDRHLVHNGKTVSDWRGSPRSLYRMSSADHRQPGLSSVYEVPLGSSGREYLYFEKSDAKTLERVAADLGERSRDKDIVVSALTHTYEYTSAAAAQEIASKIAVLKRFGRFINIKELKELVALPPGSGGRPR